MKKIFILTILLCLALCVKGQEEQTAIMENEETDRNVMLNAANAAEPREISIGLPDGFTYVIDNGLPSVYYYNPLALSTHWRNDLSLERTSLVNVSESAITTGHIGYMLNSYARLGTDLFQGRVNYMTNHFGQQQVDMNISGPLGGGWFYSGSIFQDFDPGSFKLGFTNFNDRTQFYKAALTKQLNNGRGEITFIYKYSNSHRLTLVTGQAPFIYKGDGSVKEYKNFRLGRDSYVPVDGMIEYLDMRDGEYKSIRMYDAALNRSNEVSFLSRFNLGNGFRLKANAKYLGSLASMIYQTPMGLAYEGSSDAAGFRYADTKQAYTGDVQTRMSCFNRGNFDNFMMTAELTKQSGNHFWRVGLNEWYYHGDYTSNTTMYRNSVEADPSKLVDADEVIYFDYNRNASEYYKGYENKLALYATDNWDITSRFNLYYGLRLERYTLSGRNLPYERFDGFIIGGTNPETGEKIEFRDFSHDWMNLAATARLIYRLSGHIDLHGEFTYNSQRPHLETFSSTENPSTDKISVPMVRAGATYRNRWIEFTSMFTWIQKKNNYTRLNLIDPEDPSNVAARALNYDIETYAWVNDAVITPSGRFDLHLMFTYQKPKYKKYSTEAYGKSYNFTGNIVTGVPEILLEIDPAYHITDNLRAWMSFRYFSKTYANLSNALYFNGRWETFGGLNYEVNKHLSLNVTVINFLNQTGAKGSIDGAELKTKEEIAANPDAYRNVLMTGSYIRPFTLELSAQIRF